MTPDEADALAGEYVLGTLTAAERQAFERALARDSALRAVVRSWERRLAPLDDAVPEEMPGAAVWLGVAANLQRPQARATAPSGEEPIGAAPAPASVVDIARLRRSRRLWRGWAIAASALAAGLAIAVGLQQFADKAAPAQQYLAVVNRGGDQPALIVRVDLASRTVLVRPVAAEAPAGRSLELWVIEQGHSPKSLGVVAGTNQRLTFPAVFGAQAGPVPKATFAVTLEPPGGSPTGGPTGPVVYTGELIKE
jgi:anti-sigma-K factor RskA